MILFCGSLTTTSPTTDASAWETDFSGSETTLSLFNCGYRFCIGCEKFSFVYGATDGEFVALSTIIW